MKQSTAKNNQNSKDQAKKMAVTEAILFSKGDPVEIKSLIKFLKISPAKFSQILSALKEKYAQVDSGLQIVEKKNKIQLVTKANLGLLVNKFLGQSLNEKLSAATLETLAIIAYRGPITKAQIEYIRGVNSSFALKNLLLKGVVERRENPLDNRSYIYEISFDFLRKMGLKRVSDLENYEELSQKLSEKVKNGDFSENNSSAKK